MAILEEIAQALRTGTPGQALGISTDQTIEPITTGGASPSPSSATPQPIGTAAAGTSADYARGDHVHAAALADLSDVAATAPTSGQVLAWGGSEWAPATPSSANALIAVTSPPLNSDVTTSTYLDTTTANFSAFDGPWRTAPSKRAVPAYIGTVYACASQTDLVNNQALAVAGDILQITADITLTSTFTLSKSLKLTATSSTLKITFAGVNLPAVSVTTDNTLIADITLEHTGTGSNDACVEYASTSARSNYIHAVNFRTNEFAVTTKNEQVQITASDFAFVGTADNHRYIAIYKNTGITIVDGCTFSGNGNITTTSACLFISTVTGSSFVGGKLIVSNCNNIAKNAVQRLLICEIDLAGTASDFWFLNNTFATYSGFAVFYGATPLAGVNSIWAYGNVETYAGSSPPGGKGIIGCDGPSPATLPAVGSTPYLYIDANTAAPLAAAYVDWSAAADRGIAYNGAAITGATPNAKKYSAGEIAAPLNYAEAVIDCTTLSGAGPNYYADRAIPNLAASAAYVVDYCAIDNVGGSATQIGLVAATVAQTLASIPATQQQAPIFGSFSSLIATSSLPILDGTTGTYVGPRPGFSGSPVAPAVVTTDSAGRLNLRALTNANGGTFRAKIRLRKVSP